MEGTVTISRCLTQENHCEETPCVLHDGYSFLQNIIECYLRNLTIDMLVNQSMDTWQKTIIDKLDELFRQYQETVISSSQWAIIRLGVLIKL